VEGRFLEIDAERGATLVVYILILADTGSAMLHLKVYARNIYKREKISVNEGGEKA
jgi:hypothetical protein